MNKNNKILSYFKSSRGSIIIEFAYITPVAILLFSGIYEVSQYLLLYNKLERTVGVIGDLITRQNLSRPTLTAYLQTAVDILKPFDFNANGSIVASQIQNVGMTVDPTKMTISWQQSVNGGASQIGAPGSAPTNLPNNISVINDQTMIVTEVSYKYKPLIFSTFFPPKVIYKISVFVPRVGSMNKLLGE